MPRARGGARAGQPGKSYPNRTDMAQAPRAAPSKTYGEGAASLRAQEAVPLPQTAPIPVPGERPLSRPTERPAEPLTSGLPIGPGAGPSASMPAVDPVVEYLRAAYRAFPNEAIGALLEAVDGG